MRNRDITGSAILTHHANQTEVIDITLDKTSETINKNTESIYNDPHLSSYDRGSVVSLSSVMQTSVPEPFGGLNEFTHLNMPGGGWSLKSKHLSHELNSSHYTNLRQEFRQDWNTYNDNIDRKGIIDRGHIKSLLSNIHSNCSVITKRYISLSPITMNETPINDSAKSSPIVEKETNKSKLKKAVKEYGSTVIVFHVGISLISLGVCYGLVSSGLDVTALIDRIGLSEKLPSIAGGASTFVIAYAVHKVFAPVRISITLGDRKSVV